MDTRCRLRINLETVTPDGRFRPTAGELTAYAPSTGAGIRVDGYGRVGYQTNPRYDSLLAKLIVFATDFEGARTNAIEALGRFQIEGVETNIPFLKNLLSAPRFTADQLHTGMIDQWLAEMADVA